MKPSKTTVTIALLLLAGCATPRNAFVGGVYTSPNGGFTYRVPDPELVENVKEHILPNGGNVEFYQWSHFNRIDYVMFNPTVEREIQDRTFRGQLLRNFTMNTIVPGITRFVPGAQVRKAALEEIGGIPVFYVSMFMPEVSNMSENGKRLDACRCSFTHSNGKQAYVFTVSAGIDPKGGSTPQEALIRTEERLKRDLVSFFKRVRIQ